MEKIDIKSWNEKELTEKIIEMKLPKFRAKQIYEWLHQKSAESFADMTNIGKKLQEQLDEIFVIRNVEIVRKQKSKIDGTAKYLFKLHDGEYIEAVLMQYHHGYSICISTQVGCKMGCTFCATGKGGFFRNLSASEMLAQIQMAQKDESVRVSNIVLMGMGEPLDNYENVLRFLELVSGDNGMNIGMRHISLSTCGIVDKIYDLAERKLQLTLSISLHAPNDEIRGQTMPINKKWNISELLKACRYYTNQTSRRISFEYAMIDGVNDSDEAARELSQRLKGIIAHVNLIPVNPVTETGFQKSSIARQKRFVRILESSGISATVRRTLGADIDASCGQLRGKFDKEECN
nr:23S rRNA (adenine(2503)-C(2))-methyltransferase RlmN [Scatolibacter rhodanostii]